MSKITESDSHYDALEHMSTDELLISINKEDSTVSSAVKNVIPKISTLVNIIVEKLKNNGRLLRHKMQISRFLIPDFKSFIIEETINLIS